MARLPEGTITFMLTDLQGSTRAWEKKPKAMRSAMARHDAILAAVIRDHEGQRVEAGREGDSVLAVFRTAATAAACALDIQKNFASESWPEGLDLKVRVALHTGEAQLREGHYFGPVLNRCARLLATCHPGQILLTKAVESMLADEVPSDAELQDLGLHRLKDLGRPEQVFQLNDLARTTKFPPIRSLPRQQTNMPHSLTSFVGREEELRSLKRLLSTARLVTLTGTGGAGKSRLAAEVARAGSNLWPDGVWWIELAATDDVSGAVVGALELPGRGAAQDVVASWLAGRKALLVLDNCEHVVADSAAFCQRLLERCPQLSIIATSREPLGVSGEARWSVASLRDADALLLFEARARLVSPEFKTATRNLDAVTRICERLDRLPLAIEMAAAHIDVMSEQELLNNLNDRFRFLTSGTRTAPQRQQTMAAAIDWSHRLLRDDEARLFRRLSVFSGGFTLDGAQAVCADGIETSLIDLLVSLVQKSMVVADRLDDGSTRFRLLESHHDFALDRLREAGELDGMQWRHYEYFQASLAARTIPWTGPKAERPAPGIAGEKWKARESANLWAAIRWARDNTDDMGLSLALEVADFEFADRLRVKSLLLDLLVHSPATGPIRAKAFNIAARHLAMLGEYDAGRSMADTSVTLARELGDPELQAFVVNGAGMVYQVHGDLDTAARMYDEALSLLMGSVNRRLAIEIKNSLGVLAVTRGDFATAREILTECVAHSRSEGDVPSTARHLESLANSQLGLGDAEAAAASWTESLSVYRDLNDPFGMIWGLGGLALVAAQRGDHERVLRLAAVADHMSREWSLSTGSFRHGQLDEACRHARAKLGERRSDPIWSDGDTMGAARALEYALGAGHAPAEAVDAGPLSRREREVVAMVAAGMTNREIAERLFIAERTAEGHVERIRNKLGFRSRTEVATWAVEHGVGRTLDKPPSTSTV